MILNKGFVICWMLLVLHGCVQPDPFDYDEIELEKCEDLLNSTGLITMPICEPDGPETRQLEVVRCGPNLMLNVHSASYKTIGTNNHGDCSVSSQSPPAGINCDVKNVLDSVGEECNGQNTCIPQANDDAYGDPCSNIFAYYLEIEYECTERNQNRTSKAERNTSNVCENEILNISCPGNNELIKIYKAFFKPIDNTIRCGKPGGHILDCDKKDVSSNITSLCDGKRYCNTTVDTKTFEDPCTEAFKSYLDITYTCIASCKNNKTAANGGSEELVNDTGSGTTKSPIVDDLLQTTVTEKNVNEVAGYLADILRTSNKNSEAVNIETVQEILRKIVGVGSSSPEVTEEVVETINYILDADVSEGENIANASSLILKAVEKQIAQTLRQHGKFESIKANIAVRSVTVNKTEAGNGVSFAVRRTEMGFSKDGDSTEPDSLSFIQLPKDTLYGNNDAQVSFVSFNNDRLFRSKMSEEENNTTSVLGPIISADVLGKDIRNLKEPVVIRIAPSQGVESVSSAVLETSICVYWNFNLRDGIGNWAQDGCFRVAADSEGITCSCNHLTNFAVIVDFAGQGGGQTEPGSLTFALDIISKVGCAVSIVALCITLLIFLLSSRLRMSLQRKILIRFCFSMLFLYLSFLIGIDSQSKSGCLFAGLLLHYFVLSTMFWMGVEARHMYITLVSESDRAGRQFMRKAEVFAWGGALFPVLLVLAVKQDEYLANAYCFVAPGYRLYFGLLCPIAVVILHNTITFVFVAKTLMSAKSYALKPDLEADATDTTDAKEVAQRLLNAFAVSVILGLTWAFGFLAIEEARGAFQLLFCVFNSFQGVLIFVLFCYAQKDVRKLVFDKCCAEAVPHPKPQKPKQAIDAAGNPIPPGPATSMSGSTRVTGESYSDDNDTLDTKFDDATLAVTATESTQENDHEEVELQTTSADVGKPDPKESVGKDDEALIPNSTATEETDISLGSETNSSAQPIVKDD